MLKRVDELFEQEKARSNLGKFLANEVTKEAVNYASQFAFMQHDCISPMEGMAMLLASGVFAEVVEKAPEAVMEIVKAALVGTRPCDKKIPHRMSASFGIPGARGRSGEYFAEFEEFKKSTEAALIELGAGPIEWGVEKMPGGPALGYQNQTATCYALADGLAAQTWIWRCSRGLPKAVSDKFLIFRLAGQALGDTEALGNGGDTSRACAVRDREGEKRIRMEAVSWLECAQAGVRDSTYLGEGFQRAFASLERFEQAEKGEGVTLMTAKTPGIGGPPACSRS